MSAIEGAQFVDSNILIYSYDDSAGWKRDRAIELLGTLWVSGNGCLSVQVLQEFYVNTTRHASRAIQSELASARVARYATWRIHEPAANDVLRAIAIHLRYQISLWDAMIINSAAALNCQTLWTEDLNHGQEYDGVRVINPFLADDA